MRFAQSKAAIPKLAALSSVMLAARGEGAGESSTPAQAPRDPTPPPAPFVDATPASNIACQVGDIDTDSDLDIYHTNGWSEPLS